MWGKDPVFFEIRQGASSPSPVLLSISLLSALVYSSEWLFRTVTSNIASSKKKNSTGNSHVTLYPRSPAVNIYHSCLIIYSLILLMLVSKTKTSIQVPVMSYVGMRSKIFWAIWGELNATWSFTPEYLPQCVFPKNRNNSIHNHSTVFIAIHTHTLL